MIIKHRSKPLSLQKLEAITPRLSKNMPGNRYYKLSQKIDRETAKEYKGYIGERKVDYFLDLLSDQFTILQGVYLNSSQKNFQIDTVLITDHAIFCIECKNFKDILTFDTLHKQFTQRSGNEEKGYRYPITQAETQQHLLMNWLLEHNLHGIPIHYFIAISEPSTIIKVIGDQEEIANVVVHAELLPKRISAANEKLRMERNNKIHGYQIGMRILNKCKEQNFDVLGKFSINKSDILPGVQCPNCKTLGMRRVYGKWNCHKCGHHSKHAHNKAIADYLLLFGPTITNRECRQFLNIDSRALATRLLIASGLEYQTKYRRWRKVNIS